jgi:hypothetical protein
MTVTFISTYKVSKKEKTHCFLQGLREASTTVWRYNKRKKITEVFKNL